MPVRPVTGGNMSGGVYLFSPWRYNGGREEAI
jgi:hypothetical protein